MLFFSNGSFRLTARMPSLGHLGFCHLLKVSICFQVSVSESSNFYLLFVGVFSFAFLSSSRTGGSTLVCVDGRTILSHWTFYLSEHIYNAGDASNHTPDHD